MVNLQNAPLGIRKWLRKKDTLCVGITEQGGVGGKNQSYMVNTPPFRWTCNDDPPLTSWYIFFTSGLTALGKKNIPLGHRWISLHIHLSGGVFPPHIGIPKFLTKALWVYSDLKSEFLFLQKVTKYSLP